MSKCNFFLLNESWCVYVCVCERENISVDIYLSGGYNNIRIIKMQIYESKRKLFVAKVALFFSPLRLALIGSK